MAGRAANTADSLFRGVMSNSGARPPCVVVAILVLSVFVLVQLPMDDSSVYQQLIRKDPPGTVFSLMVTMQFSDKAAKNEFLEIAKPMIKYVKLHEPTTLGYELLMSDKDDLQILFLERYVDKEEAYLKIHKSSAAFLAFRPKLKAMQDAGRLTITGNSFVDSGVGFVGRGRS